MQDALLKKLINKKVREVTIILDSDASDTMILVSEKLMRYGINISRVKLEDGDPSDIGYRGMLFAIDKKETVNQYDIIRQRII